MITQAVLDELWDFDDAAGSEARFAAAAQDAGRSPAERLELVTQQARALGVQQRFAEAQALLDGLGQVADAAVEARIALETGRLRNSAGDPEAATLFFEDAAMIARDAGLEFLEVDALHMLATADPAHAEEWAERGIARAHTAAQPRTQRWLVSLHNNRGWSAMGAGELDAALAAFQEAASWAERVGTAQQRIWAQEAVDECEAAIAARGA